MIAKSAEIAEIAFGMSDKMPQTRVPPPRHAKRASGATGLRSTISSSGSVAHDSPRVTSAKQIPHR
jgi:hypothetical protein